MSEENFCMEKQTHVAAHNTVEREDFMNQNRYADLVVKGKIYTSNHSAKYAQAFAVRDGKYVCVGSEEEVSAYIEPGKTVETQPVMLEILGMKILKRQRTMI